jgi:hypothetical protein
MHSVDLPAGFPVRFTATAPVGADIHRWKVRVVGAEDLGVAAHELSFGSRIGGEDRDQRIDIPAQDKDCRLEIAAQHQNGEAWDEDRSSIAMACSNSASMRRAARRPTLTPCF